MSVVVFNKYSLVNFRGSFFTPGGSAKATGVDLQEYNKIDPKTLDNPSVSKIIEVTKAAAAGGSGYGYMYNYADFAMDKWMVEFNIDSAKGNQELRIAYLRSELDKVSNVKKAILSSLSKADSLLKK